MKIGLYTKNVPETVGGGYVFRDDVENAATAFDGRHKFELVSEPSRSMRSPVTKALHSVFPSTRPAGGTLADQVCRQGIDMMWFTHFKPVESGVPYIVTIFDMQHRLQPWFPEVSEDGLWDRRENTWARATQRAAIITVGSEEAKEQLSLFYGIPLERIHAIPFPTPQAAIDAASNQPSASDGQKLKEKYGLAGDFLYYPAQFWAHKNHVNLLHALRLLRDEHGISVRLALTGSDQGNQPFVEATAAELGILDQVHFLGFVPREDVLSLFQNAMALAYVSFFGPENLPPLEAMAFGCPVVLSDIEGVRALFGDTPVFVDPRDPASIAGGIALLHRDPDLRHSKAAAGRSLALANTTAAYVARVHEILEDFDAFRRCWP